MESSEIQPRSPERGKFDLSETLTSSEEQESSAYPDFHSDSDSFDVEASSESTTTFTESTSSKSRLIRTDSATGPHQKPVQPLDKSYPIRKIGKTNRGFNPQWFKTFC